MNSSNRLSVVTLGLAVAMPTLFLLSAPAQAQTYSFGGPPGMSAKFNNIAFESSMEVEDILGTSSTISGWVKKDARGRVSFDIKVPVTSLKTGLAMRDKHLQSPMWLSAAKHPYIHFKGSKARLIKRGVYRLTGSFTIRGVTKALSVDVKIKEIPAALAKRVGFGNKPFLRVRASFKIRLSDFGVRIPGMAAAKVNDRWTVKLSLFAGAKQ